MRRIALVLTTLILVVTVFAFPQQRAEAGVQALPGGWSFTVLQYCRNGFAIFVQTPPAGVVDTNGYRISVTATTPIAPPRAVFTVSGPTGPRPAPSLTSIGQIPNPPEHRQP